MLKLNQYGYRAKMGTMLLLGLFILSGCSQRLMQKTQEKAEEKAISKEYHEFVAVGYAAVAAQKGDSDDIKMLNAIKASKIDAYKELAEQVYGVMLTSENSVERHQLQDEVLEVKVVGLVRGAKVLRTYHEGDLYITELGLKLKTLPNTDYADFSSTETGIHVQPQIYY
ncbi:hypothetical protein [Psychromonas algicola]|uniref:hypothetical protein n=1 Tax=Psychromonas algicola TaxID=2555642 RepID=UPI00106742E2|nr:hypothetical protein [Psychromonas sp. RZ5]TEW46024.1 hypothetical protein E2R67_13670 [Psychromonas sp. RZ5]